MTTVGTAYFALGVTPAERSRFLNALKNMGKEAVLTPSVDSAKLKTEIQKAFRDALKGAQMPLPTPSIGRASGGAGSRARNNDAQLEKAYWQAVREDIKRTEAVDRAYWQARREDARRTAAETRRIAQEQREEMRRQEAANRQPISELANRRNSAFLMFQGTGTDAKKVILELEGIKKEALAMAAVMQRAGQTSTKEFVQLTRVIRDADASIAKIQGRTTRLGVGQQVSTALRGELVSLINMSGRAQGGVMGITSALGALPGVIGPVALGFTGLSAAMGGSINKAADFERGMDDAQATLGATSKQMSQLTALAYELGPAAGIGPAEFARGLEEMGSAGLDAQDAIDGAARSTILLSKATRIDLAEAAEISGQALNAFNLEASDLEGVADTIAMAANTTILKARDFKDMIGQGGAAARAAGLTFQEYAAVIALTRNNYASASDAGTGFKSFINSLVPTSEPAIEGMKKLGFSAFNASGQMKPLTQIADELRSKLLRLVPQQRIELLKAIFGADGARTAIGLMNSGGKALEDLTKKFEENGTAAETMRVRTDNMRGAQERLKATWEALQTQSASNGPIAVYTRAINALSDALDRLRGQSGGDLADFNARFAVQVKDPMLIRNIEQATARLKQARPGTPSYAEAQKELEQLGKIAQGWKTLADERNKAQENAKKPPPVVDEKAVNDWMKTKNEEQENPLRDLEKSRGLDQYAESLKKYTTAQLNAERALRQREATLKNTAEAVALYEKVLAEQDRRAAEAEQKREEDRKRREAERKQRAEEQRKFEEERAERAFKQSLKSQTDARLEELRTTNQAIANSKNAALSVEEKIKAQQRLDAVNAEIDRREELRDRKKREREQKEDAARKQRIEATRNFIEKADLDALSSAASRLEKERTDPTKSLKDRQNAAERLSLVQAKLNEALKEYYEIQARGEASTAQALDRMDAEEREDARRAIEAFGDALRDLETETDPEAARNRAQSLRELAESVRDPAIAANLNRLADRFEHLSQTLKDAQIGKQLDELLKELGDGLRALGEFDEDDGIQNLIDSVLNLDPSERTLEDVQFAVKTLEGMRDLSLEAIPELYGPEKTKEITRVNTITKALKELYEILDLLKNPKPIQVSVTTGDASAVVPVDEILSQIVKGRGSQDDASLLSGIVRNLPTEQLKELAEELFKSQDAWRLYGVVVAEISARSGDAEQAILDLKNGLGELGQTGSELQNFVDLGVFRRDIEEINAAFAAGEIDVATYKSRIEEVRSALMEWLNSMTNEEKAALGLSDDEIKVLVRFVTKEANDAKNLDPFRDRMLDIATGFVGILLQGGDNLGQNLLNYGLQVAQQIAMAQVTNGLGAMFGVAGPAAAFNPAMLFLGLAGTLLFGLFGRNRAEEQRQKQEAEASSNRASQAASQISLSFTYNAYFNLNGDLNSEQNRMVQSQIASEAFDYGIRRTGLLELVALRRGV